MVEKTDKELMTASKKDIDFYTKSVEGLPTMSGFKGDFKDKYGIPIPYGSGAHIVKHFRKTIKIVKPKNILEIGFNCGCGSALWLNLCDAKVVSCDVSDKEETIVAAQILKTRFGERFKFFFRDGLPLLLYAGYFDIVFIDGDHKEQSVIEDIELALKLNIKHLLFDDCYKRFGDAAEAIKHFPKLELVHDMDNLRLYKNE